ncbi:MAG: class III signal peptide-containing protein [Methanococci archaeon]|nr:class III signal peptide-containing protein [Methanococci archaeon]
MILDRKISSKKGQLSMEVGILISSAVLVGVITTYIYIMNFKKIRVDAAGKKATNATETMTQKAEQYRNSIKSI